VAAARENRTALMRHLLELARAEFMSEYDQLLKVIRSRRSVRQFSTRAVGRDDLDRLLEAARWAPSNLNRQPWRFLVFEGKQVVNRLAELVRQGMVEKMKSLPEGAVGYAGEFARYASFSVGAPVLLVVLHKEPASLSRPLLAGLGNPELVSGEPLSAAMAIQNLLLAAQALGLGACVLTGPLLVKDVLAAELDLPAGHDLTCLVALGYPLELPAPPRRKAVEQIAEFRTALRQP
jgi:nitroreductase